MPGDEVLKAFELGQRKIAVNLMRDGSVPVGSGSAEYDIHGPTALFDGGDKGRVTGIPVGAITSDNVVGTRLMPGQFVGQKGTAIYQPLRSSIEVEAILGEKRYKPRRPEDQTEKLKIELAQKDEDIKSLAAKLSQLTDLVAAQNTMSRSAATRRTAPKKKEPSDG